MINNHKTGIKVFERHKSTGNDTCTKMRNSPHPLRTYTTTAQLHILLHQKSNSDQKLTFEADVTFTQSPFGPGHRGQSLTPQSQLTRSRGPFLARGRLLFLSNLTTLLPPPHPTSHLHLSLFSLSRSNQLASCLHFHISAFLPQRLLPLSAQSVCDHRGGD